MMSPSDALRRWLQLATVPVLSFGWLLLLASGAVAHDCDLRINPEDCQNTAWTVGTAGVIAAAAAVAAAVAVSGADQAEGPEWVHAHVRAVASEGQGSDVAALELLDGQSPPTAAVRIVAHTGEGSQHVEEVDE